MLLLPRIFGALGIFGHFVDGVMQPGMPFRRNPRCIDLALIDAPSGARGSPGRRRGGEAGVASPGNNGCPRLSLPTSSPLSQVNNRVPMVMRVAPSADPRLRTAALSRWLEEKSGRTMAGRAAAVKPRGLHPPAAPCDQSRAAIRREGCPRIATAPGHRRAGHGGGTFDPPARLRGGSGGGRRPG